MDQHYDETPLSICFEAGRVSERFAFDGTANADMPAYNRLRTLAWVGLLRERRTENRPAEDGDPNPYRGRTSEAVFVATESGRHFALSEREGSTNRFCYGRAHLKAVLKLVPEPQAGLGRYVLRYTYTVTDVAAWALDGSLQSAYPVITKMLVAAPAPEAAVQLEWDGQRFKYVPEDERSG